VLGNEELVTDNLENRRETNICSSTDWCSCISWTESMLLIQSCCLMLMIEMG